MREWNTTKRAIALIVLFITSLLVEVANTQAQPLPQDTVWTSKTDQAEGFFRLKFSKNDSIIAGMGFEMDLFFDTKTGSEIRRIPGNNEVFFIGNDNKFLRVSPNFKMIEIWSTESWTVVDSLQQDELQIGPISVSNDERYVVGYVANRVGYSKDHGVQNRGIRIWDLQSKQILQTKLFPYSPKDTGIYRFVIGTPIILCNNSGLLVSMSITYQSPGLKNETYTTISKDIVYNFPSLDSIDSGKYGKLSHNCLMIAKYDSHQISIYDFNTMELQWKMPPVTNYSAFWWDPTDRYSVTATSNRPEGKMTIWDISKKEKVYEYGTNPSNIDISHNGKYIVTGSRLLSLYYAKWNGLSVPGETKEPQVIYPNPTNGMINLQFNQQVSEITAINIQDSKGAMVRPLFNGFLTEGPQNLSYNISDLATGTYFVQVQSKHNSLIFKLMVVR